MMPAVLFGWTLPRSALPAEKAIHGSISPGLMQARPVGGDKRIFAEKWQWNAVRLPRARWCAVPACPGFPN